MKLQIAALLAGVAVVATACGSSPAALHPRDTSVSDNVEQAQIRSIANADKADQRAAAKVVADKAASDKAASDKAVANKAVADKAVADKAAAKKVTASPTPKATPKAIPKQPDCAAAAMKRGKFDPNCSAYQGYLDPGTSAGRPPTSGEIQNEYAKKQAALSALEPGPAGPDGVRRTSPGLNVKEYCGVTTPTYKSLCKP